MKNILSKITAGATALVAGIGSAMAAPSQTATDLLATLQTQSAAFLTDTTAILMAGAGVVIGGYLVFKLVNLVIGFFKRG